MTEFVNRDAPPAINVFLGLSIVATTALWHYESISPGATLGVLSSSAVLLLLLYAWRLRRANTSMLRRLERKRHHLECNHRRLQQKYRQQSDELLTSCRNYRELVESANSIILRWSTQGIIRYANTYALDFFGYREEEFIGQQVLDTIVPLTESTGRDLTEMIDDISRHPEHYTANENENICRNQRRVWIAWTNKAVLDGKGNTIEILSVGNDITEKKHYERQIYQLAHYDQLTQLPNRNQLGQCLEQTIERARCADRPLTVLYLGLDRFKSINDSLGRHQGDSLLRQLATRMQSCLGRADMLARMGGDEFCIIWSHQAPAQQALQCTLELASELRANIGQAFTLDGDQAHISASIGIAAFPEHGAEASELLKHAETAMHHAKARSGNCIQLFEPTMAIRALHRLKLENALRLALENDTLELYYQPALNLNSDRVDYVEALLRWHHPTLGSISPSQFIDVAEHAGLMPRLGQWVLNKATQQAAHWRAQGYSFGLMAVNLSLRQFEYGSLIDDIEDALHQNGLPPQHLALEITESSAMHDIDYGQNLLQRINDMGITLLIDDFGTGHSSLSRLHQLPIHTVKIDRSFISDIRHDNQRTPCQMVDTIINLAHGLGMQVIAEGVETEQQRRHLAQRGCDRVQGYLISAARTGHCLQTEILPRAEQLPPQISPAPALACI